MKKLTILFFNLFLGLALLAQQPADRSKMENERKALQKELKEIQSVYNQVKGQRRETIGQLNLVVHATSATSTKRSRSSTTKYT